MAILKDKISGEAYELFMSFLELANIGDLTHPNDMDRWRAFVIRTHLDGTELRDTDISDAITERYPHASKAVRMGGRFIDERALLAEYDRTTRSVSATVSNQPAALVKLKGETLASSKKYRRLIALA